MGGMLTSREDKHIQQLSVQKRELVNQLIVNTDVESGIRPQHATYISPLGKINNPDLCRHFDFKDPQSQILLKDTTYNQSLGFKEKILQVFYSQKFSFYDLKEAIKKSVEEIQYFNKCLTVAGLKKTKFMTETRADQETAFACCLAIAFYTGNFQQDLSRSSNILIKLQSMDILKYIKGKKQLRNQICISYWLLKAISFLPLYVNQVTRCINLQKQETQYYNEGNVITWLQFSSGSQEQFIPYGLQNRNTRFHIFSITARKISAYSQFQLAERQVLFKPFTHFLILKKEKVGNILHIYMRQVVIGQASMNVLWVDDKIFSPDWQHKKMVETITRMNPCISIIPKSSTKTASAFMSSLLGSRRKTVNSRIVTTLARQNEENQAFAGIVLLKEFQEAYVTNLKILVLSNDVKGVEQQMIKLAVKQPKTVISNNNDLLKSFVSFK